MVHYSHLKDKQDFIDGQYKNTGAHLYIFFINQFNFLIIKFYYSSNIISGGVYFEYSNTGNGNSWKRSL